MEIVKKWWLTVVLVAAAVGIYLVISDSNRKHEAQQQAKFEKKAESERAILNSMTVQVKVLDSEQGQLLVIRTPVKSEFFGIEMQTCFVWRDAVTKASSLDCSKEAEMLRHRDEANY